MKKIIVILIAIFIVALSNATIYVGPTQTYTTIQAGIQAAADGETIIIDSGEYIVNSDILIANKQIIMHSATNNPNDVIIKATNNNSAKFLFDYSDQTIIYGLSFRYDLGLYFTNSEQITIQHCIFDGERSSLPDYNQNNGVTIIDGESHTIRDCTFAHYSRETSGGAVSVSGYVSIFDSSFESNGGNYGGAVFMHRGRIDNCSFDYNVSFVEWYPQDVYYEGGAIYISADGNCEISNSSFNNNAGSLAGAAIAFQGNSANGDYDLNIYKNSFDDNYWYFEMAPGSTDIGIVNSTGNIDIKKNIFRNSGLDTPQLSAIYANSGNIDISNNTMVSSVYGFFEGTSSTSDPALSVEIFNNIFKDIPSGNGDFIGLYEYGTEIISEINYNIFDNCYELDFDYDQNQYISSNIDTNLQPIWNSSTKSVCIDAGYSATGETDLDGTPLDIGAVVAVNHFFDDHLLPDINTDSGIEWLCFRGVDNVFEDANLLHNILYPNLDDLDFVKHEDIQFEFVSGHWTPLDMDVHQTKGYVLKVDDDVYVETNLAVSGFVVPNSYSFTIEGGGVEDWIGYFPDKKTKWDEAFGDDLDKMKQIKHQDWCYSRNSPDDLWSMSSGDGTLYPGDMVKVKLFENEPDLTDFSWNSTGGGGGIIPKAKSFTFTETTDYTPVYIDLEEDRTEIPEEVGVYVDGICKGAGAVINSSVMVPIYLTGQENLEDCTVEFELYYGERKPSQIVQNYTIFKTELQYFGQINLSDREDFYHINFDKSEDSQSVINSLSVSSYPNPFNPETTIKFNLPEAGEVSVEIFNCKGQRVKQLVHSEYPKGINSIVWHGDNQANKKVSSGVYFYRITTKNDVAQQKIMLLK